MCFPKSAVFYFINVMYYLQVQFLFIYLLFIIDRPGGLQLKLLEVQ